MVNRAMDVEVINIEVLDQIKSLQVEGDEDFFNDLIKTYLEDMTGKLGALQRAYAQKDMAEITRITHSAKSSSAALGALELSAMYHRLEMAARDGLDKEIGEMIVIIVDAYKSVSEVLTGILKRHR